MDWMPGWSKRIKLTIDHNKIGSVLYNFPVLVNLDATCSGVFNELTTNSKRIYFSTKDTKEPCYCEIEHWAHAENYAQLWVKIPIITNSGTKNTDFYMYYDNFQENNTSYIGNTGEKAAQQVWKSSYKAVYHMSQDPSIGGACILDSTSNENHGTPHNMSNVNLVDGPIGKSLTFSGLDEYVAIPSSFNSAEDFTWENNTKSTSQSITVTRGAVGESIATNIIDVTVVNNYAGIWYEAGGGSNYDASISPLGGENFIDNQFHYSANMFNDLSWQFCCSSGTFSTTLPIKLDATAPCFIAWNGNSGYEAGTVDEIRISDMVLSEDWCKTTIYSLKDDLLTRTLEETNPTSECNYQNRIKLTIPYSYIDESLYNFPILVNLSSSSGLDNEDITEVFTHLGTTTNRKKIAVTDYTKTNQCYVEIERWSQAEHSAQLWIKVPEISSTSDTILYLYYDNTQEDNVYYVGDTSSWQAQHVWDYTFVAVYHMSQDPSGEAACILDSTSNSKHGTSSIGMTSENLVGGSIGKALLFDGSTNYTDLPIFPIYTAGFSLSIKIKNHGMLSDEVAYIFNNYGGTSEHIVLGNRDSGKFSIFFDNNTTGEWFNFTRGIIDALDYVQLDVVYESGGQFYLYYNGELDNSGVYTYGDPDLAERSFYIGQVRDNSSEYNFKGFADEVRFSTINRQAHWIATTYKSNTDNLILYDIPETDEPGWLETYVSGTLNPWSKRIKLEIDNTKITGYLTDFPTLINLCDSSGVTNIDTTSLLAELGLRNKKIAITSKDGMTQLPIEIENWEPDIVFKSPPGQNSTYVKATSSFASLPPYFATDRTLPLTGGESDNNWASAEKATNQKFNIDYGTSFIPYRLYLENEHSSGATTTFGIKNFIMYGTNDAAAFANVTYTNLDNLTKLDTFIAKAHVTSDVADPQYFNIEYTNTAFRYYIFRIADNYGHSYMGIRHIEVQGSLGTINNAQLWTKVPNIRVGEDNILYLYYDITKEDNTNYIGNITSHPGKAVWDDNYLGIYHMNQYPRSNILDSTNQAHGTYYGSMVLENNVFTPFGRGLEFDGIDDYIRIPTANNGLTKATMSCLVKFNTLAGISTTIVAIGENNAPGKWRIDIDTNGKVAADFWLDGNATSADGAISIDTWYLITSTFDGAVKKIYVNEVMEGSLVSSATAINSSGAMIGSYTITGDYEPNALIKYVSISDIARSSSWVKSTYNTTIDNLITYGVEEVYTEPPDPPGPPLYYFHGYIKEVGDPVARVVNLYNRSTGVLADTTVSNSATGYYELTTYDNVDHYIVVLDDDEGVVYNPIVQDRLTPNG